LKAEAYSGVHPDPRYQVQQDFGRPRRWPLAAACIVALLIGAGAATTMMHPDAVDRLYERVTGGPPPWANGISDTDVAALEPQPIPETPLFVPPAPIPQPALPPSAPSDKASGDTMSTPEPSPSPATPIQPTPPAQQSSNNADE